MRTRQHLIFFVAAIFFLVAALWLALYATGAIQSPGKGGELFKMSDRLADLEIVEDRSLLALQVGGGL